MKPIVLTEEIINEACESIRDYLRNARMFTGKVTIDLPKYKTPAPEDKPTVLFTKEAEQKIKTLVSECNKEIGWHGTVEHDKETNTYTVTDILMFPQTVTGTTVNSIDEEYGPWLMGLEDDVFNKLRLHGHSHVNMGVTPSATDTNHQETLLEGVEDYYIFMIINKKNDITVLLYSKEDNLLYETKDINVVYVDDEVKTWAKNSMETYIKEQTLITNTQARQQASSTYWDRFYNTGKTPTYNDKTAGVLDTVAEGKKKLSAYEAYLKETKPYLYGHNHGRSYYYE